MNTPSKQEQKPELETRAILQLADLMDKVERTDPTSYFQSNWGLELVDHLLSQRFTPKSPQTDWPQTDCGSNTCIAGWAVAFLGAEDQIWKYRKLHYGNSMIPEYAQELLGLSHSQSEKLFISIPYMDRDPTPRDAAMVLRHLAATGKVDWQAARTDETNVPVQEKSNQQG